MDGQAVLDLLARERSAMVAQVLAGHRGLANGISVAALARACGLSERAVRAAVNALRMEGVAVGAHPAHGYYLAETPEELELCCQFLRRRALTSLTLEARLRRVALPDLVGQLRVES